MGLTKGGKNRLVVGFGANTMEGTAMQKWMWCVLMERAACWMFCMLGFQGFKWRVG